MRQYAGLAVDEAHIANTTPTLNLVIPMWGAQATAAMVRHYAGLAVDETRITGVDRLGLDLVCKKGEQTVRARLPFSRPADSRKDVKDVIVEMTRAAAPR